jgi:hypothetical protein
MISLSDAFQQIMLAPLCRYNQPSTSRRHSMLMMTAPMNRPHKIKRSVLVTSGSSWKYGSFAI